MSPIPQLSTARWFLLLFPCVAVFFAGCNDYNVYSLEMTPRGQVIQRTLTCWRIGKVEGNDVSEAVTVFLSRHPVGLVQRVGIRLPALGDLADR